MELGKINLRSSFLSSLLSQHHVKKPVPISQFEFFLSNNIEHLSEINSEIEGGLLIALSRLKGLVDEKATIEILIEMKQIGTKQQMQVAYEMFEAIISEQIEVTEDHLYKTLEQCIDGEFDPVLMVILLGEQKEPETKAEPTTPQKFTIKEM